MSNLSPRPLISIVIPTYNRIVLLQKAIASILAQNYENWELIIVDDGSTDGTSQLVRSMAHPRIKVLELGHSGHIGHARNSGVQESRGEWLAFLDSDDVWMPGKLNLQLEAVKRSGASWCYGNFELMNESGEGISLKAGTYRPLSGWIIKQLLSTEASVNISSVLVRRSLFDEVGGFSSDPRLLYRGDYEFGLRLALRARVTALPDVLIRVLEHGGRATAGLKDGNERTALAYEIFLHTRPAKQLKRLANRQRATHLAEAALQRFKNREYAVAWRQFARALLKGAGWKQWISVLYHGIRKRHTSDLW